jgi:hypothetical protein
MTRESGDQTACASLLRFGFGGADPVSFFRLFSRASGSAEPEAAMISRKASRRARVSARISAVAMETNSPTVLNMCALAYLVCVCLCVFVCVCVCVCVCV